jgi:hypothetical protein
MRGTALLSKLHSIFTLSERGELEVFILEKKSINTLRDDSPTTILSAIEQKRAKRTSYTYHHAKSCTHKIWNYERVCIARNQE